jgi:hypothetical protein
MNGKFIYDGDSSSVKERRCNDSTEKSRREVTRNFDWSVLYNKCRLYRDFVDGLEYYYYPQLFHIATNLVNVEKGKNEFLRILKSNRNVDYEAYYRRNWKVVLNVIIAMNYQPQGCCDCPYTNKCFHAKNMILTAKPGKSTMIQTVKKEYVSIGEAENDLRNNFHEALNSDKRGIHLIKAQTGIGKTNLYLNLLKQTSDLFLIAVPTHRLKMEIYHKACDMGIDNISYTPELPEFSSDLQDRIKHAYDIGAGEYTITILRKAVQELKPDDPDYTLLRNYLDAIDRLKEFRGHIITTHERFILMRTQNTLIEKREIIIDEDIMRTILSTYTVSNDDIFKAIKSGLFTGKAENRLKEIIASEGYQRYDVL